MPTNRAALLPFPTMPRPQDRTARRAEDGWATGHIGCRRVDEFDADLLRFGGIPEPEANALPVPELDLLVEVEADHDLRDHLFRHAKRRQQWSDRARLPHAGHPAEALVQLRDREEDVP